MTVYVLGAGASLHAGYPPAGRLGEDLYRWVRQTKPDGDFRRDCVELCAETFDGLGDLERVLTELESPPPGSPAAALRDAQRRNACQAILESVQEFFSSLRDSPSPLYDIFARTRVRPGDAVITFNYDLACERALKGAGLWEIGDGYGFPLEVGTLPASLVKVLKLHGSTSWWWPPFGGQRGVFQGGLNAFPQRPALLRSADFTFLGYAEGLQDPERPRAEESGAFPALIPPTRRKRFYARTTGGIEQKDFWDSLWEQAGAAIGAAEAIVVVGYSMPQADQRARELLLHGTRPGATVTVACAEDSDTVRGEFRLCGSVRAEVLGDGRFEAYLAAGRARAPG